MVHRDNTAGRLGVVIRRRFRLVEPQLEWPLSEILKWVTRYETQACPSLLIEQSHDRPRSNDLNAGGYTNSRHLLAAGASGGANFLYLLACLHNRVHGLL
jgi:hypothetical protein